MINLTRLRRDVRLLGRVVRHLPRVVWQIVRPGGSAQSEAFATRVGRRAIDALATLGADAVGGTAWVVASVALEPPRVTLHHADGRAIEIALEPRSREAFARTAQFSVGYRGARTLDEDTAAQLERFAAALRAREVDDAWLDAVRRPLLRRVSYYPAWGRVELRPTLACNHHCAFCNSVDRSGADNVAGGVDDLIENLDLWRELPVLSVGISGGEPTLVKRLGDLVAPLADAGLFVEIQTNGMAFAEPGFATSMANAGVRALLVSLHAADADLSDTRITGFAGGWERTVRGIDAALDAGLTVSLSHVVHEANGVGTADFVRMVAARWGRRVRVRLAFVAPTGGARAADLVPPLPALLPGIRAGLAEAQRLRLRLVVVSYCGVPPCLVTPFERFTEVARGVGRRAYGPDHTQLAACAGCRYAHRCPGLWTRYVELHGDPGVRPL